MEPIKSLNDATFKLDGCGSASLGAKSCRHLGVLFVDAGRGTGGALGTGKWGHQFDSFRGRSLWASTRRILEPAFIGDNN